MPSKTLHIEAHNFRRRASTIGFQALVWSPGEQHIPWQKFLELGRFLDPHRLRQEAHDYLEAGKLQEMRAAPGNRRVSAVFRERQDGTTAVVIMSIWDSLESIRALVGGDQDQPWITQEELDCVFDSDHRMGHYSLSDASVRDLLPPEWHEESFSGPTLTMTCSPALPQTKTDGTVVSWLLTDVPTKHAERQSPD